MNTGSVRQAFRLAGAPLVLLTLLCVGLGVAALRFDPGATLALSLAGIGALVVFFLIADVIVPPGSPAVTAPDGVRPVDRRRRRR
jgi:hypothetical protein